MRPPRPTALQENPFSKPTASECSSRKAARDTTATQASGKVYTNLVKDECSEAPSCFLPKEGTGGGIALSRVPRFCSRSAWLQAILFPLSNSFHLTLEGMTATSRRSGLIRHTLSPVPGARGKRETLRDGFHTRQRECSGRSTVCGGSTGKGVKSEEEKPEGLSHLCGAKGPHVCTYVCMYFV